MRARTSDPLIKSAFKLTPAGYGSYDLLTLVTGCSRQRVYMLIPINASFSVFWSQVGHRQLDQALRLRLHVPRSVIKVSVVAPDSFKRRRVFALKSRDVLRRAGTFIAWVRELSLERAGLPGLHEFRAVLDSLAVVSHHCR